MTDSQYSLHTLPIPTPTRVGLNTYKASWNQPLKPKNRRNFNGYFLLKPITPIHPTTKQKTEVHRGGLQITVIVHSQHLAIGRHVASCQPLALNKRAVVQHLLVSVGPYSYTSLWAHAARTAPPRCTTFRCNFPSGAPQHKVSLVLCHRQTHCQESFPGSVPTTRKIPSKR